MDYSAFAFDDAAEKWKSCNEMSCEDNIDKSSDL